MAAFLSALMPMFVLACGSEAEPPPAGDNLLANPGFEEGEEPWFSLASEAWGPPFRLSGDRAHSGESSAYLEMSSAGGPATQVFGVVQEISPASFPARFSGYYLVDRWQRGSDLQYLQAVAIVWNSDLPGGFSNHQVRYLLAGTDREPFTLANGRFVFVSKDEPAQGEWVRFDLPLAEDFERLWGAVPQRFERIRLLFEARYEGHTPAQPDVVADVYYDDLYVGP